MREMTQGKDPLAGADHFNWWYCEYCLGQGQTFHPRDVRDDRRDTAEWRECRRCNGSGVAPIPYLEMLREGEAWLS
jgi:DnaJ-class molecular chaperone